MGAFSKDFATLLLPVDDLLPRVCLAPRQLDMQKDNIIAKMYGLPLVAPIKGKPTLCGLTHGARDLLGLSANAPLSDLPDRSDLANPDEIFQAIAAAGDRLQDPLFNARDICEWAQADIDALLPILRDALLLHPDIKAGNYVLRAEGGEEAASLYNDAGQDLADPAIDILREVLDFDTRFRGEQYEYNDGIASRASGYYLTAPEITNIDIDGPPSRHERLAAWSRMHERLHAAGVPPETIADLIGGPPRN